MATAEFVHTADGDRLIRRQEGATTVYLPGGQELTLESDGTRSATRYYSFAGQTVASRDGATMDDVSTLVNDHHGTAGLSITNVSAEVSYRYSTPFGGTRGAAPEAWSGDHGFLDKPTDASGLTAIGARYYDSSLGRFISVDPIMDLTDPQQWAAYNYSNNNPTTWSDPTGMIPMFNTIPGAGGKYNPSNKMKQPKPRRDQPPTPPEPETVNPSVVSTSKDDTKLPDPSNPTTPEPPSVDESSILPFDNVLDRMLDQSICFDTVPEMVECPTWRDMFLPTLPPGAHALYSDSRNIGIGVDACAFLCLEAEVGYDRKNGKYLTLGYGFGWENGASVALSGGTGADPGWDGGISTSASYAGLSGSYFQSFDENWRPDGGSGGFSTGIGLQYGISIRSKKTFLW